VGAHRYLRRKLDHAPSALVRDLLGERFKNSHYWRTASRTRGNISPHQAQGLLRLSSQPSRACSLFSLSFVCLLHYCRSCVGSLVHAAYYHHSLKHGNHDHDTHPQHASHHTLTTRLQPDRSCEVIFFRLSTAPTGLLVRHPPSRHPLHHHVSAPATRRFLARPGPATCLSRFTIAPP
jgi:hypothetical protein